VPRPILYVSPTAVHGGAEEVLLRVMLYAHELDYAPVLVAPRAGWLTEQCAAHDIPAETLPVIPDTFATTSWRQQLRPWLPSALGIARLARKWRPAIVHSNTPRVSYHGGLGARLAGVRTVTHVHDIYGLPYASRPQARLLAALADWTLVPSHAVERAVVGYAPGLRSRIQTLYNGWDAAEYDDVRPLDLRTLYGIPPEAVVVGSAAAMHPWKGQDVLIEAFRSVREREPRAHLMLVGGAQGGADQGAFEAELHRRVAAYGLGGGVTFTGWREDALAFIRAFDVFVHTPTQPDPLPTAVLHAAALGRAIVAANTGGIPEIVPDGMAGLLVPSGDAEALARTIMGLLDDPARRASLGAGARAHFIERFSRRQMMDGLVHAYEACLRQ
jgi:glycosyltransferase involved in cell wall biosynthesis